MLTCDICGGDRVLKVLGGHYVCQDCGFAFPAFEIVDRTLKRYRGDDRDVVVPDGVVAIGEKAFFFCTGILSVTLPDTVNEIQSFAFEGCLGLREIRLPEGLKTIGHMAFSGCENLWRLWIPDQVEDLDYEQVFGTSRLPFLCTISLPRHRGMPRASCFPCAHVEYRDKEEDAAWQREQEEEAQKLREDRRQAGVCEFCGGAFHGFFSKTCSRCGRKKSY